MTAAEILDLPGNEPDGDDVGILFNTGVTGNVKVGKMFKDALGQDAVELFLYDFIFADEDDDSPGVEMSEVNEVLHKEHAEALVRYLVGVFGIELKDLEDA